ncbi:MAG: flagellar motor protein MotB [Opitutales bacterium]
MRIPRRWRKGSHAGAWKVAYADFVTGMMSLFLVLWILSQDEEVIIATTRFFRDPWMAGVPSSVPVEQRDARPGSMVDQIVGRSDTTMRNSEVTTSIDIDVLHRIAQDWYRKIKMHDLDEDEVIQIEVINEGLKVTLYHGDEFPIFANGSNELTDYGNSVMQRMSWLLARHVLTFTVDAHTSHDSTGAGYTPSASDLLDLTPVELNAKRCRSAFQMSLRQADEVLGALVHYSDGDLAKKVESIIGHGYTKPNQRFPNRTEKNRRVELSLKLDVSEENLSQYSDLPTVAETTEP